MLSSLPPSHRSPISTSRPESSLRAAATAGFPLLSNPAAFAASSPSPRRPSTPSASPVRPATPPSTPCAAAGMSRPLYSARSGPAPRSGTRRQTRSPAADRAPTSLPDRLPPTPPSPVPPSRPARRCTPRSAAPPAVGAAASRHPTWPATPGTARSSSTPAAPSSSPASTGIRAAGTPPDRRFRAPPPRRSCRSRSA